MTLLQIINKLSHLAGVCFLDGKPKGKGDENVEYISKGAENDAARKRNK